MAFHDRYCKMNNKLHCQMSMKMISDLLKALFCDKQAPRIRHAAYEQLMYRDNVNYGQLMRS